MTTYIQLLCKSCFVQLCAVQHPTRPSLFFINACIGFLQLMWLPSGALKKVCPLWAAMISTDAVSREEGQGWQPLERKVFAAQDGLVQSSADSKQELTWMGCSEWWVSTGSDLEEMLCWLAFSDGHSGFLVTTFCATRALENKSNGTQLTYLPTSHSIQLLHINSLFFTVLCRTGGNVFPLWTEFTENFAGWSRGQRMAWKIRVHVAFLMPGCLLPPKVVLFATQEARVLNTSGVIKSTKTHNMLHLFGKRWWMFARPLLADMVFQSFARLPLDPLPFRKFSLLSFPPAPLFLVGLPVCPPSHFAGICPWKAPPSEAL